MDATTKRRRRMQEHPENAITIAVSSRVLFNNDQERLIYEQRSMEDIISLMKHEPQPFSPGPAFSFVKALETVNIQLRELYPDSEELFRVILMTNNDTRVGLTGGNSPIDDLRAYHTNLYLSADAQKVQEALEKGIAAADMFTPEKIMEVSDTQLRVAFDGDGVLFSDESERVNTLKGLEEFIKHETVHENDPLGHGPMKDFLEALGKLQKKFYDLRKGSPIRTYLVTARGTASGGIRALKTLRSWGLQIDEAIFLRGAPKGPVLEAIRPHIFFDDKESHVRAAAKIGTVACHVPYGISQGVTKKGVEDTTLAQK